MLTFRTPRQTDVDQSILTDFITDLWHDARSWTPRSLLGAPGLLSPREYVADQLMAVESNHVLITEDDGVAVGMGCLAKSGEVARIIDVFVSTSHRNAGVGRAIIEQLEEVASKAGVVFLDVEVANGNRAQNLYSRMGYQPFTRTMRRTLRLPYSPEQATERVSFSYSEGTTVWAAFDEHAQKLRELLPFAEVEHIGASSVEGALSKGDIDIGIGVEQSFFLASRALLGEHYERNLTSTATDSFASFKCDSAEPPLGIQLYVSGSDYDVFTKFRSILMARQEVLDAYNCLKRDSEGMTMGQYREKKGLFIAHVLNEAQQSSQQAAPPKVTDTVLASQRSASRITDAPTPPGFLGDGR